MACGGKPLVIKSPVHTARVALLLKLFPRAKFIYLHRNPLQVFQSGECCRCARPGVHLVTQPQPSCCCDGAAPAAGPEYV